MHEKFIFFLALVVAIVLLIILSQKIRVAYPILLVIAGLVISFIPGVPAITIDPDLIFIIFLPPLLYEAAWNISFKQLWKWRRIISSFAFIVVFFTAFAVGITAYYLIPGFTLALGFLLGGIVSPPDAVSAGAIMKFVKVPKSVSSVLEGESLLNDASSLIIFQFAMIAVLTGKFVWYEAAGSFFWMVTGGVGIGLLIGKIFMEVHKKLPTDANIDTVLTLVAPYIMYLTAEEVHSSGVLAVVSGGLFLSRHQQEFLGSASRLRTINVWQSFGFLLNGIVFMMIGLDLPQIISELGDTSITTAIGYGVLITAVLVVVRFISSYGAIAVTLVMRNFITVASRENPGWKIPMIFGWSGMRGVVSLAAALSIPVSMSDGTVFPQRNLILFITFVVILLTLVIQGLTLPPMIRLLKLPADSRGQEKEEDARLFRELTYDTISYMKNKYGYVAEKYPFLSQMVKQWEKKYDDMENVCSHSDSKKIYLELLQYQRRWLVEKNLEMKNLDDEIVRRQLMRIDLEEERLNYTSF